ncbi:opsin, ultraviolet-sensitive-like [Amyelois transitella]|uniref:opsin, ultraviolet-sensitive-like n=1 Tax=Amyelois transitella TaxID=680683 RepID=UPI00067ACCC9|nr:opsin, ultraviolet-sensitive-like [Amyelois transitella]
MSKTIQLIFILLSVMQCYNLNDSNSESDVSVNENSVAKSFHTIQTVILKRLKCHQDILWGRSGNLKLWKKRRRTIQPVKVLLSERVKREKPNYKIRRGEVSEPRTIHLVHMNSGLAVSDVAPLSLVARFKKQWPERLWREKGLYTNDYLVLINSHWLHFPPPDPSVNYVLGSLYIVMMAVGCSGNAYVLFMYLRCRSLRTPGNILVANLALSDFMMLAKTPIFIFNSFHFGPALGKTGCVIYGFVGGLTGTTSIATLSAIALDRYWAVVRPLEAVGAITTIRARILAVVAWLYAAIFASVPAFDIGYGRYVPEGYLTSCSFDYLTEESRPRIFIFVFFCAAWVAPFCTIFFCYLSIFRTVVCNRNITTKNQEQRLSSRHVKERAKRKAEIKLAALVMAVIALFFISWTPYAVVALLGIFGRKDLITPLSSMIPALFCKTAACINPFIYIITHPNFRKEFKKLLYRDKSRRMGGTMKTIGYYTESTKMHRPSKDLSDTDVEIIEMTDIPYQTDQLLERRGPKVKTISSRVIDREGSQKSISMKSFEEDVVSPPSWYSKPKFAKKKSFQTRSLKSIVSLNTDPTI